MRHLAQDVRFGFRVLAKSPGFTIAALLAIALGIGANTAIFTIVKSVLLSALPYPEADRLVCIRRDYRNGSGGISDSLSGQAFLQMRETTRTFDAVTAYDFMGAGQNLTGDGDPERIPSIRVSHEYLRVFGVSPQMGRAFTPEDEREGAPLVVLLTDGVWKRRFGGDPGVLGKTLTLSGQVYQVAGILPATFTPVPEADMLLPLRIKPDPTDRANMFLIAGRLKPGIPLAQANQDLDASLRTFKARLPQQVESPRMIWAAADLREQFIGEVRRPLLILLGAVAFVLLIACANVANLQLVRAQVRQKEIAIRTALGAPSRRIVRQLLTESVLLSMGGAALGMLLAHWGLRVLTAWNPGSLPRMEAVRLDGQVFLFTAVLAAVTGILFGLAPALQAARGNTNSTLREASGRVAGSTARRRLRSVLVGAEVVMAVVLLTGAALLLRTFQRLGEVQPGFDAKPVLTFQMSFGDPRLGTPADLDLLVRRLAERVQSVPGVESAALVTNVPMDPGPDLPVETPGLSTEMYESQWRNITPRYFEAMQVPLRNGRFFTDTDSSASEPVAIVNETFVRQAFPNRHPIGEPIVIGRIMGPVFADKPRRIVGVVGDIRENGLQNAVPPAVYIPTGQIPAGMLPLVRSLVPLTWVIRTTGEPMSLYEPVRRAILSTERSMPLANARTMQSILDRSLAGRRFNTMLLGLFAALALTLAAIGVYGLLSYAITQRTNEIGIRMAMGARRGQVLSLVLGQSLLPVAIGLGVGVGAALLLTRLMASQLYGVSAYDPVSFLAVPFVLALACVAASLVPSLRALKVDPVIALRYE